MRARRFFDALLAAVMALGLIQVSCGSDDEGPSCSAVCDKMSECDPEESQAECLSSCADIEDVLRSSAFSSIGECTLDSSCAQLAADDNTCFDEVIPSTPNAASKDLLDDMCKKMVECDDSGEMTQTQCESQMTAETGDMLVVLSIFKDSVLDCIGRCISGTACAELGEASEDCFAQCGVTFGVSVDDQKSDPS